MTQAALQEIRYTRARGPAHLVLGPVDRAWLAACRRYRQQLMAGLIPRDNEGRYNPGPGRADFEPKEPTDGSRAQA